MKTPILLLLPLLLACGALADAAAATELAARDAYTGAPVAATVTWTDGVAAATLAVDGAPRVITPPPRRVRATARAAGYLPLAFTLDPAAGPTTLLLEPAAEPAAFRDLAARAGAGRWLQGWVRNGADGSPVAGAAIHLEGASARSDATGYFELALPACHRADLRGATLEFGAASRATRRVHGVPCWQGISRRVLALGPDLPADSNESLGAIDRLDTAPADAAALDAALASFGTRPPAQRATELGLLVADTLAPPDSIRVGFNDAACTAECCGTACSHSCIKPLETYVRTGLAREWISSWAQPSLRAGSIAYRSYGAWHVDHPRTSSYDICSSACCQVNGNTTYSSTNAATAATPGILLTQDGTTAFRAEYSAENNSWKDPDSTLNCSNADLSCGDGQAGSPSTGWPCLADPVSSGHSCFGHGRGMSQWGTSRWAVHASAPAWPWITDHYYNDNGAGTGMRTAVMSSPLAINAAQAAPASVSPGGSFLIQLTATNLAGAEHAHLLIGASLYRSGAGFIDDPAHDGPAAIAPGSHGASRSFTVPPGTAPGSWDLWVSLYLDADENGTISGTDLALALAKYPAAVTVTDDDRIFRDGFDG